ncbi:hypothetical protein DES53_102237 [Roseimicrobium gellanilyticum]|uniref:DUF5722 domain-containing protein n=1 Tax=Roseimicrobium gellanilyticum TaxID=748857 RepID=A0A366HSF1_9BACT|nr:DUF5722 domain-containing protein [Roseimicrobium gellanilyticum]RBP45854.1 hypothetical protein DES53_102237 [Roseimicrobium gellanilyticum]
MPLRHFITTCVCTFSLLAAIRHVAAQNTDPFPTPPSKKGLQVQMVDDALALGIHHAAVNVSLGAMFHASKSGDLKIDENYLASLDKQVKPISDAGVVVYLILLAYPTGDAEKDALLLHPARRQDGKFNIAAFNTAKAEGPYWYRKLIAQLADRFSGAHPEHGRVWGYIVGNEVNSHWMWYNLGNAPMAKVASEYEKAVRATHEEVRKHSAHARVYLSFDHHWNASMPGISAEEACKGRDLLDTFAKLARERGDFEWHVAHHPYPDDLGNPRTWLDKAALPNADSPHITFKNLEVACEYMKRPELLWQGKPRRIILSEQGIHCLATPDGGELQAAGYAYAWEKTTRQDGIDALIWHRHVDHAHEGGLRLGLWENQAGSIATPGKKREIYGLFLKAGTPEWTEAARKYLSIVGLKSWDELK